VVKKLEIKLYIGDYGSLEVRGPSLRTGAGRVLLSAIPVRSPNNAHNQSVVLVGGGKQTLREGVEAIY